jgi:hypothetical protein
MKEEEWQERVNNFKKYGYLITTEEYNSAMKRAADYALKKALKRIKKKNETTR